MAECLASDRKINIGFYIFGKILFLFKQVDIILKMFLSL